MPEGQDAADRAGAAGDNWDGGSRAGRIGTILREKWRIDKRIGRGGMATVYAATHRNGNRVAIKMLHTEFSREATVRARFLREAYVANGIGHRGTVRVLDDDVAEDGAVFLVMDLLEGETLEARRVRCGGRLPLNEVLDVTDELLDLLATAHERGVVHRDIKPENIFITERGEIKVLDFGIARLRDQAQTEQTGTGIMLGTPDFMSPEQARGSDIDARCDLWSTGATIFTLLSGEAVHHGSTLSEHLDLTANSPARSLRLVAPYVPERIVSIVDRALALEPENRWPDARTMQRALRTARGSAGERDSKTIVAAPVSEGSIDFDDTVFSSRPESNPKSNEPTVMRDLPPELAGNGSFMRPILRQHQLDDDDPTPMTDEEQAPRFQPRFGVQRASTPAPMTSSPEEWASEEVEMTHVATPVNAQPEGFADARRTTTAGRKMPGWLKHKPGWLRVPDVVRRAIADLPPFPPRPPMPPLPVVITIVAVGVCILAGIIVLVIVRE